MERIMKAATAALCLALTGCGSQMTPEQAAVLMQYQQSMMRPAVQYTPHRLEFGRSDALSCQSSQIGNQTYTNCR